MENRILAYCHIPKNAGSLVTYVLRSKFGADHCRAIAAKEVYDYRDLKSDLRIYPSLKALSGHPLRPFEDFKEFEQHLAWAVLLRDPYARFPSQYKWWCKQNNSNITFEEWCELKGERFSNFQCKWIAGIADHKRALGIINAKRIIIGFQSNLSGFIEKMAKASSAGQFPWNGHLVINAGERKAEAYSKELIEKYNEEDISLYGQLFSNRETGNADQKLIRPFTIGDKFRYYVNLAKHRGIYKPYKDYVPAASS